MTASAQDQQDSAPVRLAVFDYDGTIISGQSGLLFMRYLLRRRLISARTAARLAWWGTRYKLHLPFRQDESRELICHDLALLSREDALRVMREFHERVLAPRTRAAAAAELRRRREEGCVTLLVSATFFEIARMAAERLGVDGVAATRMELDDNGRFTGRVAGEVVVGEGKVHAVRAWANSHAGVGGWRVAYAYGDHFSDEPLLELAEAPCCVSPGSTLARIAHRRGWQIVHWR